jgi:hypothetical protein
LEELETNDEQNEQDNPVTESTSETNKATEPKKEGE